MRRLVDRGLFAAADTRGRHRGCCVFGRKQRSTFACRAWAILPGWVWPNGRGKRQKRLHAIGRTNQLSAGAPGWLARWMGSMEIRSQNELPRRLCKGLRRQL